MEDDAVRKCVRIWQSLDVIGVRREDEESVGRKKGRRKKCV